MTSSGWLGRGIAVLLIAPLLGAGLHAGQANPRVAPRDQVTVTVFNAPDLSGKFPVDAEGVLVHPELGAIKAAGLTVRELEELIAKRFRDENYLLSPRITIELQQTLTKSVSVTGAVHQQGAIPFAGDLRLYDALVRAGMPTDDAGEDGLIVRPAPAGAPAGADPTMVPFSLTSLKNGSPAENILLQDGDRIFVHKAQQIYITGYVNNPNAYTYTSGMTVRQALALAGDISEKGTTRGITIWRKAPGKDKAEELKGVKLSDPVKPGDTINVKKSIL